MKLTRSQSAELVDKLADEIVANIEKTAAEAEGGEQLTDEQIAAIVAAKKKQLAEQAEKEESQPEDNNQEEKAAAVYYNALSKMAASEEMFNDGVIQQQACIETLAEAGLYDENGLNKQAAESSQEAIDFTNRVAEIYDDGEQKIAAAQECYAEAEVALGAAMEVLAGYGYTFD